MSSILYVKKLSDQAKIPQRCSKDAAGLDLFSNINIIVPAKGKACVSIGLAIQVPFGTYGRIAPRSGLALKQIDVGGGVIDLDYRGEVKIILFNHSNIDFKINYGDRIAQLILEKIEIPEIKEVNSLSETNRGMNGFGSTGIKLTNKEESSTVSKKTKKRKKRYGTYSNHKKTTRQKKKKVS